MDKKVVLIILDGVGVGELPDAYLFSDQGSNTIANTAKAVGGLNLPNLQKLGLGNITSITGVAQNSDAIGSWGKAKELALGKDSTSGHWEIMGRHLKQNFPCYPNGFPDTIIKEFITQTGCKGVLGNKSASGTEIINELGKEHLDTKYPIIYTSADSVFQVACHKSVLSLQELYDMCRIARKNILVGDHSVARVIARPFIGDKMGNFVRTSERKDFSLKPTEKTVMDTLKENGYEVVGIGKIEDLFASQGLTMSSHSSGNQEGIAQTIEYINRINNGLIFTNLVDFDTLWGHRNDYKGFAKGLEYFDSRLPDIISALNKEDILIITADHGCDPTTPSTDHSREYIPIIVYGKSLWSGTDLGIRNSFADIGATIAEYFNVELPKIGKSFLSEIV
ncbi:MAG: phosphopentomutase [Candidatus Cloacimonadota bacterium]|nr:MAG: phosphopentomutase [Candidatus Cloacimonadota bacterium]